MHQSIHVYFGLIAVFLFDAVTALPIAGKAPVTLHNVKRSIAGPVIVANFPDPGLINVDNTWYAFATRTKGTTIHIQIATSTDFDTWNVVNDDALPDLPAWVNSTSWNTWSPDVHQLVG